MTRARNLPKRDGPDRDLPQRGGPRGGTDAARRPPAPFSLTRRLAGRLLALVALGWLLAAAGALYVLDHETGETLNDALRHEAQLLAVLAGQGVALPDRLGEDRALRLTAASGEVPDRPWPAPPSGSADLWAGGGWHVARSALPDGRWLELAESNAARREELGESIRGLIFVMLPLALALLLVIRLTLGQALRPVAALSAQLGARDAADLAPVPADGLPTELAPVADSLNRYLSRISALLEAERSFAANAAHELRTPIAAARAQAQLLAAVDQDAGVDDTGVDDTGVDDAGVDDTGVDDAGVDDAGSADADRVAAARRVIAALDRLSALTERLVQLARAESGMALTRAPVDLTRIVPLILGARPASPGRPLRFDDGDLDRAEVMADADGLAILIGNLVDNALRHGSGPIRVALSDGPRLTVTNPVPPGAQFREGRFDRDPGSTGLGLGLTIARALADQASARLTAVIADGVATVTLDWGDTGRGEG